MSRPQPALAKQRFRIHLSERWKDRLFIFTVLAPGLIMLLFTIGIPIVRSLYLSVFNVTLLSIKNMTWGGLSNYTSVLTDRLFFSSIGITFMYVFFVVVIQFVLGIALATLLNRKMRMQKVIRTVILIPWIIPTIVGALLWMWLFQPQYGVLNYILLELGIISESKQWLSDYYLALPAVMVAALWRQLPFMSTMLLAGMQGISDELYEAADIDGANSRQKFFYITLPMLKNTIKTVTLIACIENFKMFPLFWIMTGGGPLDRTTTLAVLSYKTAFIELDLGKGAAIGALWLLIMLAFSWVYNRLFSLGDKEEGVAS